MEIRKILLAAVVCILYVALTFAYDGAKENGKYIGKNRIYYGASYYPEAWDEKEIDKDIIRMKELNMNVMRLAEFAWRKMEPTEGNYDFAWLHRIIEKLNQNGIDVILGTPTATPPAWLGEKYPEIYLIEENGTGLTHGARRNTGYTNRIYREYSKLICEKMAQEFGKKPGVIGWQTDNEFNHAPDYSEETRMTWHTWLEKKYNTIENLNKIWCLDLWSQAYNSFSQIPMPGTKIWHHPSLRLAWDHFINDQIVEFQDIQLAAIRKYSELPITHDGMPGQKVDYEKLFKNLNYTSVNNYHSFEAYDLIQSNYDRMRGLKKGFHWLFETAPNNSGGGPKGNTWYLHQIPGSMRAAIWMNYASGAQGTMFWLWRQHWAGQEMPHGSVINAWGKKAANYDELKGLGDELKRCSRFLMDNPVAKAEAAIFYSHDSDNGLQIENFANGIHYYKDWTYRFFRPMADAYIFRDVLYPDSDISGYKLISVPLMPYINNDLRARLKSWVEKGGILIIGPMSGYRTSEWTHYTDYQMGDLEPWAGIEVESFVPIGTTRREKEIPFMLKFSSGSGISDSEASLWALSLNSQKGTVIAQYTTGHHAGKPAVIENKAGKGKVVVLGTDPGKEAMKKLYLKYATEAGIMTDATGDGGVVIVPRKGKEEGMVIVNIANETKTIRLNGIFGNANELISGQEINLNGEIKLSPYEIKVLVK